MAAGEELETSGSEVSRRGILAAALTGGAAAILPLRPGAAQAATAAAPVNSEQFFASSELNFQGLFALGAASYNASQPGEVLETFNRIHARGDTYLAYYEEFLVERGWNALIFERPGQGSNLFLHNIPFRPDWTLYDWLRVKKHLVKQNLHPTG